MLKSIKLTNFFSFQDEIIHLQPETNILVGINGSGKSNLLKAIRLLKETVSKDGLKKLLLSSWGGFDSIHFLGDKTNSSIKLAFEFDFEFIASKHGMWRFDQDFDHVVYEITIDRTASLDNYFLSEKMTARINNKNTLILQTFFGGTLDEGVIKNIPISDTQASILSNTSIDYYPFKIIQQKISQIDIYDTFDTSKNSNIRKSVFATTEKKLSEDGTNLVLVLNYIKTTDKDSFRRIIEMLHEVNPNFTGIDFNLIGGNIELMLEENALKRSVHVTHISEGTLHYLCLLAILFNSSRGEFICIDEPEIGLHPDMIRGIVKAIESATHKTQFIIPTHSENMLNKFNLENIIVFEKDNGNTTKAKTFNSEEFAGWYEQFSPGNMWRNGDLGGNRW